MFCCCGGGDRVGTGEERSLINADRRQPHRRDESGSVPISVTSIARYPASVPGSPPSLRDEPSVVEMTPEAVLPHIKQSTFIAEGRFGEVYKGTLHVQEEGRTIDVAIKRFRSSQKITKQNARDFFREVEFLSKLDHPNILKCFGASTRPPHLFLVTEYAEKGSLFDFIDMTRKNPVGWEMRLQWAAEIASAMYYLHSQNPIIVHRDLKSLNILVFKDMHLAVCDFGLSRSKEHTFVSTNSAGGSPAWMAPEILRGERFNPRVMYTRLELSCGSFSTTKNCPAFFFDLTRDCWADDPAGRPDFEHVWEQLKPYAPEKTLKATETFSNYMPEVSAVRDRGYDPVSLGLGLLNPDEDSDMEH